MKKNILLKLLPAFLLCLAGLMACDNDGDWDPMKWKTEVKMKKVDGYNTISVPAEGGTYRFKCTNYPNLWFCDLKEDEGDIISSTMDVHQIHGEWATVGIDGVELTVSVSPNDGQKPRTAIVVVNTGDIWCHFKFNQRAS